jgi:GTP-binding protein HflX
VVDAADPDLLRQMQAVEGVLEELLGEPRPTVLVFNKLDLVGDEEAVAGFEARYPGAFLVSAKSGAGLDPLRAFIWEQAAGHAAGHKPAALARGAGRSS